MATQLSLTYSMECLGTTSSTPSAIVRPSSPDAKSVLTVPVDSASTVNSIKLSLLGAGILAHLHSTVADFSQDLYTDAVQSLFPAVPEEDSNLPLTELLGVGYMEDEDDYEEWDTFMFFQLTFKEINSVATFTQYYLNSNGSRWVMLDKFGNKDKITLKTRSGMEITRTVQFYEQWGTFVRIQITYKGTRMFVSTDTILED